MEVIEKNMSWCWMSDWEGFADDQARLASRENSLQELQGKDNRARHKTSVEKYVTGRWAMDGMEN